MNLFLFILYVDLESRDIIYCLVALFFFMDIDIIIWEI